MGQGDMAMRRKTVAVIGCGALGALIADGVVHDLAGNWNFSGVLARRMSSAERLTAALGGAAFPDINALLARRPDMVVEAAGAEAARLYAGDILRSGASLILLSAGVLAEEAFARSLKEAAEQGCSVLYVASGAIGGFDVMRTLAFRQRQKKRRGETLGSDEVLRARVDNLKGPGSLEGAPFLEGRVLSRDHREIVFEGSAAEAIRGFPKNVNVAVAAAAASAGMEGTAVSIVSDPALKENTHRICINGFGVRAEMEFASLPDPRNPRSSTLSAWSVLALLDELASPVRFF